MAMTIELKTCFAVSRSESAKREVPEGVRTIKDFLLFLGKEARFDFVDARSGQLEKDLEILVNGKEVWFYPSGLDRPLEDGDVVEVYLIPLGGG
jgi:hypothetical protein